MFPEFLLPDGSIRRTAAVHSQDKRYEKNFLYSKNLNVAFFSFQMINCLKLEFSTIQKYFSIIDETVTKLLTEVYGNDKTFYYTSENRSESHDLFQPFYKVHNI